MDNKENAYDLENYEYLTQQEVANFLRVSAGTVKNWRERGLLSFWQAPGSTRVLYFAEEVKDFVNKNTVSRRESEKSISTLRIFKGKPVVSADSDDDWRM